MKRFVIVGLGNFGSSVAESLHALGHEVAVVDQNEDAVDRVAAHATRAVVGDGRDIKILEKLGARGADAGVVSTGDDIAASILAVMMLRDLEVQDIYVKVISHDHGRVMERLGVTDTIFPERETALSLATRLSGKALLNYVRLGPGFSIQEMAVPTEWEGKTLRQLELRTHYGITVVALHDVLTDTLSASPDPDAPLNESDTLLVAGKDEDLARAAAIK